VSKLEYVFKSLLVFFCALFVFVASLGIWGVLQEDVVWRSLATLGVVMAGVASANLITSQSPKE
jgi:hypothetical protein